MNQPVLLWPQMRWPDDYGPERQAAGEGVECVFVKSLGEVTDAQWGAADALISIDDPLEEARLSLLTRCRILVTPKVGYDNIDLAKYGRAGIPVCNVPDYGTQDVADHAMGLLLCLMKGIGRYSSRLQQAPEPRKAWNPMDHPLALRLSAARLGLVGLGRIGTAMALRAKAFGMAVTFYDPYKSNGSELALNIQRTETLESLFAESDMVSLHAPLTEETRRLIDAKVLGHAKQGLVLVNTARGEILDLDALHDALKSGQVGGAGLDVLPEEPANPGSQLVKAWQADQEWLRDRLLITPHAAFYTPQSLFDMRTKGVAVALKYLRTGQLDNCVNQAWLDARAASAASQSK